MVAGVIPTGLSRWTIGYASVGRSRVVRPHPDSRQGFLAFVVIEVVAAGRESSGAVHEENGDGAAALPKVLPLEMETPPDYSSETALPRASR